MGGCALSTSPLTTPCNSSPTGADLAFHRALVPAARDLWLHSAWENTPPVISATLAPGIDPADRSPQEVAAGHRLLFRSLDAPSALAVLGRHLRGAVAHVTGRLRPPASSE